MKMPTNPGFEMLTMSILQTLRARSMMRKASRMTAAVLVASLMFHGGAARADSLIPASVQLTPVAQFPGTKAYMAPDYRAQRARLHSVYLVPIEVFLAPDSPYKGIDPDEMAQVTRTFAQILTQEVMKDMIVVDTPQPDSLILQIALTDVRLDKQGFRLRNLTPVGIAINGVKRIAGVSKISFKTMTVQAIGASGDNETLLFAIDNPPRPGDVQESVRLDEIPAVLATKAQNLRAVFEAIRDAH
ncbi:DUF3313 family protein [Paraburkholderia sp. SARCC-3016]|uniref:DUF3313 family protein n=1 Tax=Paraburkholderia sp. SARCC-3016 TaxID=3058611 RepID=UPI002809B082|nr:DUF3313 family protein [Paraburkholderia sp. SARCC-3016]MDQ7981109.1 DUF3313 family protein [Paraburkholderia sp. SARCC-3016]